MLLMFSLFRPVWCPISTVLYCSPQKSGAIEKINKLRKCICMLANCSSMFQHLPQMTWYMVNWAGTHCTSKQLQNVFDTGFVCKSSLLHGTQEMAYQSLLTLHEKGHENWVTYVKSWLCKCDYGFVWLFGGVCDEKLFLKDFKETSKRRNFTQDWFSHLSQSTRFEMYHCFKSVIGRAEYLDLFKVNIYRTALARFRFGMSPLNCTGFVTYFQRQIVCAHFALIKLKTKRAFFLTASCMETSETCT